MLKLDHVVFPVRDAAASLGFYRGVLGLPLVETHAGEDWGGYPWLMMIFGLSAQHELVLVALEGAPAADYGRLPPDVRHYALSVGAEVELDAWRERLEAAGVALWEERHGERRSLYFSDPDGVVIELTWPAAAPRRMEDPAAVAAVLARLG
ncbi:MAG: VOC family protein [Phenylobacterium sp.]|uniref:VOC family protein n=1 Tax=Phenylobacterium sp. TaxID=1871053 RepID=UPI003918E13D